MSGPQNLRDLGKRLDEAERKRAVVKRPPPPSQLNIATRFGVELVAALLVGGAIGWGIDWLAGRFGVHTKPVFLILFVVLGAVAGIRNVMRAAGEINAEIAAQGPAPSVKDDEEA